MSKYILKDSRGTLRCWWCGQDPLYLKYHDQEWGVPTKNDQKLFEKLSLEGFQAGLSWITILRKRENFREAFDGFELERVSKFNEKRIDLLLKNEGIIRHRGKIVATIKNARCALRMQQEQGSLAAFFWQFEPRKARKFNSKRAISTESTNLSNQLKKQGWKFVGPTTCYSFMQSMGFVNDHHPDCFRFQKIELARERFRRPASDASRQR